ncbi:hypothetical protein CBP51_11055 [Cellvibrio mixtus]|uniref:Uncharacterized protein n=1 Tax=Cellvibrio mixtus TaxID=39650 RepID=A0A266QDQ9_9GAMM|nr:hypothetical protein [Cellvibrio mixtus]OZY87481.1 hypothetical protein CBP51_11055 [Cellvibrio mixtus]
MTGVIDGSGGVDRVNLTGINSDINLGIGATAVADLKIADIEVVEANTNRNNTLIAEKSNDNAWEISARNAGKLNDTVSFSGFANLIGGEKSDVFSFINELSDISGFIDGNKGHDSLDLSISNRDAVVRIVSDNTTANNNNIRIKNIEEIAADARKNNQLIASDLDNLWTITATDAGRLSDVTSSSTIVFSNFKHLTGGNQNDTFNFESTGNITGFIDGAGQREQDVVDVSKSVNPNIVITAVGAESGYANIEKFIGNNITSSITGDNRVNNWVVHNNSGTINSSIMFEGFANLIGGNNQDTFLLDNAALSGYIDGSGGNDIFTLAQSSVAGGISGGAGDDVFNITVANGFSGTLDIRGGQGDDRLFIFGGDVNYKATHQQGVLQYTSPANLVYTTNYSDIMEITDSVIADSLAVSGTSASDIFTLQNNKYWLNPTLSVNYLQKQNLIINGAADDQVKIDGTVSIAKTFTVNNASLIGENAGKIIAQNLELIATQDVGSNSDRLKLAVDNIYLKSTKGNVYIDEQDSLTIKEFSTSTTTLFDLLIGGDLLSSTSINYAGQFNANSQYGNIILNNANAFTGNLNLKAVGDISIKNSTAINLDEVRAQNLSVEADGTVTGIGSIIVNGLTSISSGANVTFMHADNDLNSLAIVKANNVFLKDKNSLTLTGVSASGDVSLSAKETVNIASACVNDCAESYGVRAKNLEINTGAGAITVGKNIDVIDNLTFRANGITVNDALSAKNINLNAGAGTLLLSERGNLNGLAGNSIALSGNRIEQRSVIKGNGEISFVAADDIQMANGSLTESLSGNVTYRGKNIALGSIKAVNGSVNLTANGAISDNNGDDINIEANRWNADAIAGIGVGRFGSLGQDAIETDVNILSVRNAGKLQGDTKINILNTDSLIIEQLRNNGDISIANLTGDIILDNTNNEPFNINDSDARTQGGVINAGTNGGILTLSIPNGMVRAENKAVKSNPDIIADIATFDYSENTKFSFGERDRKIVMHIPSFYKQTARTSSIIWYLKKPLDTTDSSTPIKNLMSNDQLIQIEGLSEIDPAIFTNVSNYIHDEVAILMPADQRFDEDEYAE